MARVIWTDRALAHLDAAADFIARDSPRLARLFVERAFDATDRLAAFPRSGGRTPEFNRDDLREVFIDRYRIIYRLQGDIVDVVAVRHGARGLRRGDVRGNR